MWQFVYSNAANEDNTVKPPLPAQPEEGSLGRLLKAIECGAPIRVGMLRSGTIHYSVFAVENVRYWKTDDDTDYVALASLVIGSSNLNYDPTESNPDFGPWFNGVSVSLYHTPAIAIVDTKGNERFWQPGNPNPWKSEYPRVFRWYADIQFNGLMRTNPARVLLSVRGGVAHVAFGSGYGNGTGGWQSNFIEAQTMCTT